MRCVRRINYWQIYSVISHISLGVSLSIPQQEILCGSLSYGKVRRNTLGKCEEEVAMFSQQLLLITNVFSTDVHIYISYICVISCLYM